MVTGGASGIGEATVSAIISEGGRVVIADLQEERGRALVSELGSCAAFHFTDVTREDEIAGAIAYGTERVWPSERHGEQCGCCRCYWVYYGYQCRGI